MPYEIAELKFEKKRENRYVAYAVEGKYECSACSYGRWRVYFEEDTIHGTNWVEGYASLEEAIALCQKFHRAAMLAGLVEVK